MEYIKNIKNIIKDFSESNISYILLNDEKTILKKINKIIKEETDNEFILLKEWEKTIDNMIKKSKSHIDSNKINEKIFEDIFKIEKKIVLESVSEKYKPFALSNLLIENGLWIKNLKKSVYLWFILSIEYERFRSKLDNKEDLNNKIEGIFENRNKEYYEYVLYFIDRVNENNENRLF